MSSPFNLRVPGYRPFIATLVEGSNPATAIGEVEAWHVTGPAAGSCSVQAVANALVTVMGARGRSMRDVAIYQDRRKGREEMVIHLQLGDPEHKEFQ